VALRKWKISFLCKENKKFLHQHCLSFQVEHICTIYDHFNKLCHNCSHIIGSLAWKLGMFIHDSCVLGTLFLKKFNIPSMLFLLANRSHNMTQCEGFIFYFYFEFLMTISKGGQNSERDCSYIGVESCQYFCRSMKK
jgi:hypothetical protein